MILDDRLHALKFMGDHWFKIREDGFIHRSEKLALSAGVSVKACYP